MKTAMGSVNYSVEVDVVDNDRLWITVYQVQSSGHKSMIDSRVYGSLDDGLFWARVVILDFIGDEFA
jgi:hypothetical protein